jgi:hypothetical protein
MVQLPTIANKYMTFMTRFEYTHFSVSFDETLNKMYSFQVKNEKIPFVGGLLEETQGTYFHGKNNIRLKEVIFRIPVNEDEYEQIFDFVNDVKNDKEYIFNYVSALFMLINGGVESYKAYHCVEFASVVLSFINKIKLPKETYKMHPKDLYKVLKPYLYIHRDIYSNDFEIEKNVFYERVKFPVAVKKSFYSIKEAIYRAVFGKVSKNFNYKNVNFYDDDIKR